ncbi:hypothetical protein [Rossellomorea sp. DA94]|uniref:hypothetical protein n=1 Tax=Rossellomorea sp. DA94 TaxID=3038653 RepID=UPI00244A8CF0|nr:hypothetical protein [Rossellomorea sp. DA94]WGG47699.1 hypothetical protein P8596_11015 [Rossellomorea sp. DA94]
MGTNEALTLKSGINEVKLRLLNLGMTIESGTVKRDEVMGEVLKCINDLEGIDDLIKVGFTSEI